MSNSRARFEAVFVEIRDELVSHFAAQGMPSDAVEWYKNVRLFLLCAFLLLTLINNLLQNLDANVPGGKLNRGLSVVDSVEILRERSLEGEEYKKAAVLGWCVELASPCIRIMACTDVS
jgi:farnesyl diphosphate synthase